MRTYITKLCHNCKELSQFLFIHMNKIFANLALQIRRKECVHFGKCAKCQRIYQNPKRNIVISISLIFDIGSLCCLRHFLQIFHQSIDSLMVFSNIIVVCLSQICPLRFPIFLCEIIRK